MYGLQNVIRYRRLSDMVTLKRIRELPGGLLILLAANA
jgi:hypothetical protein